MKATTTTVKNTKKSSNTSMLCQNSSYNASLNSKFKDGKLDTQNQPYVNLKWVSLDLFYQLTGITPDTVRSRRNKHIWDETITKNVYGHLLVNLQRYYDLIDNYGGKA